MFSIPCNFPGFFKPGQRKYFFHEHIGFNLRKQFDRQVEMLGRATHRTDQHFVISDNIFKRISTVGIGQTQQENSGSGRTLVKNGIQRIRIAGHLHEAFKITEAGQVV